MTSRLPRFFTAAGDAASAAEAVRNSFADYLRGPAIEVVRLASQVRAKDELSFDYRPESAADARPGVSRAEKVKAKADGEGVLTPLVERAAAAIVAAARK